MAEQIIVPANIPAGSTLRVEYEILTTNEVVVEQATHEIKQALWADPRFDYQGSKIMTVGDVQLGRDVTLLVVYVTIRTTHKTSRLPIESMALGTFEAYMRAAAEVWAEALTYVRTRAEDLKETVGAIIESVPDAAAAARNFSIATVLTVAALAYLWFFGVPKRRH